MSERIAEYWVHGGDLRDDDGGHPFSAAQGERRVVLATDHATAATALREAQERIAALTDEVRDRREEKTALYHELSAANARIEKLETTLFRIRDSLEAHTPMMYDELIADIGTALKGGNDEH